MTNDPDPDDHDPGENLPDADGDPDEHDPGENYPDGDDDDAEDADED